MIPPYNERFSILRQEIGYIVIEFEGCTNGVAMYHIEQVFITETAALTWIIQKLNSDIRT